MKTKLRLLAAIFLSLLLSFALLACAFPSEAEMREAVDSAGQFAKEIETILDETDIQDEDLPGDPDASIDPANPAPPDSSDESDGAPEIDEDGIYTSKEEVALYLFTYGHLPENFITKDEARAQGWSGGSLEPYCPGKCIGGDRFGNREGILPSAKGRQYYECDIDTLGAKDRGAKRIVYSDDGLIYYTEDHYESFTLLYGEE